MAVATVWLLFLEWWCAAGAAVHSKRVGGSEIRHLERVDLHELPDSRVVWTEGSYAAALSTTKVNSGSGLDTNEARQRVTGLSAAATSGGTFAICMWKRSSTHRPILGHTLCRFLWSRRGQETDQTRASAGSLEEIVGSTAHRADGTAKSTTTSEQDTGERERRFTTSAKKSGRSKSRVHTGTIRQRASGPRSSENSVRTLRTRTRSPQSSHRSHGRTPTRPLFRHHRQHHHRIAQSWKACRATGASPTSRIHTHQRFARIVLSCWNSVRRSGRPNHELRRFRRRIQTDALESIARRRVCHIGKEALDLQASAIRKRKSRRYDLKRLIARRAREAVRVARKERLVLATVNVKSLEPKDLSRSHKYGVDAQSTIDQVDRELNLHGCHVVGVEESCIKGNVTREKAGISGIGVEAWVHRSVLKKARVRPEPCSPRFLVLKN